MRQHNLGISLIELMIALLVGLILLAGLVTLFIETSANVAKTERQSAINTEGQFALSVLAHELEMAGFWGRSFNPGEVYYDNTTLIDGNPLATGTDCGASSTKSVAVSEGGTVQPASSETLEWVLDITRPIEYFDDHENGVNDAEDVFDCLTDGRVQNGTDVIAIRRVAGNPVAINAGHTRGRIYLRANDTEGGLFRFTGADGDSAETNPADLPSATVGVHVDWPYVPKVFFISNVNPVGEPIPSLCYEYLQVDSSSGLPKFDQYECVAEGIENMQLEFGIDDDRDGVVDYYEDDPDSDETALIATVRIHLLARSARPYYRFNDQNTYVVGDQTITADDAYFRQVFSKTVSLMNPTRLRTLQ